MQAAWADAPTLCDILETPNCEGVSKQGRRSSSLSLPSPATSANVNPATTSFDKGFGIEFIHQSHNHVVFNLVTGTGKLGGALISSSLENAFFGNRVVELDEVHVKRQKQDKQYDSKKLNLALAGKLVRREHFALDAGLIFKRHSEVKKINPGFGLSGRLGPLHIGASVYNDDLFLNLKDSIYYPFYGQDSYSERFLVQAYSVGSKIGNFSFDTGLIRTNYKFYDHEDSKIYIYSGSFFYKNILFNLAVRNEMTPGLKYIDGELKEKKTLSSTFAGVQLSLGKRLIIGVNYNYFLLNETSFAATIFI